MIDINELRLIVAEFRSAGQPMTIQASQMEELLDRLEETEKERDALCDDNEGIQPSGVTQKGVVAWARLVYARPANTPETMDGWEVDGMADIEFHNRPEKPKGEGWRPLVIADTDDGVLVTEALENIQSRLVATFRCEDGELVGTTTAKIRSISRHDDGVIEVMIDHWPQQAAHPAITHCDDCGCDWLDNGLNPVGCPYCKQSSEIKAKGRVIWWHHVQTPHMVLVAVETKSGAFECQIPYQEDDGSIRMQTHYSSQETLDYNFANGGWVKVREM